jgi:hypothetical protein
MTLTRPQRATASPTELFGAVEAELKRKTKKPAIGLARVSLATDGAPSMGVFREHVIRVEFSDRHLAATGTKSAQSRSRATQYEACGGGGNTDDLSRQASPSFRRTHIVTGFMA